MGIFDSLPGGLAGQQEVIVKAWFEGDFEGFKKTHGNAYFCNVIKYRTKVTLTKLISFVRAYPVFTLRISWIKALSSLPIRRDQIDMIF
jgi:hypothetical protein